MTQPEPYRPPCPHCNELKRRNATWEPFCSQWCAAAFGHGVFTAGPAYYDFDAKEWRDLA